MQNNFYINLKAIIPWYVKIITKIILARIPLDYNFWQRIGIFKHGDMDQPGYAYHVYKSHYERVIFSKKGKDYTVLELGPGDSLFSALVAYSFNASCSYLVDVRRYVRDDIVNYQLMVDYLVEHNLRVPDVTCAISLYDVLKACNAHYEIEGIKSLRKISNGSIDFIWSNVVLEHIQKYEFIEILSELHRILRTDGVCSHRIDLKDHLGGGLNNLRFSASFWESDFMRRSGFYTNRIRYNEMLAFFRMAGFDVKLIHIDRWPQLPIPRNKLSIEFRNLPEDDLLISGFDVVLTPH